MSTAAQAMADAGNGAPAPAAPAPAAQAPAAAAPAAPAAAPTGEWFGSTPETKTLIEAKKWDSVDAMAKGYINLEKLVGKDPASIIALPKEGDTEAQAALWTKLGRPEKPEGYKLEGEDAKNPVSLAARQAAHAAGLTQAQFEAQAKWMQATGAAIQQQEDEQFAKTADADMASLKTEWGAGYDRQLQAAKATMEKLGLTVEEVDKLERALGTKALMTKFAKAGEGMLEPQHVDGQQRAANGALTPAQAAAELKALGKDRGFMERLRRGDREALATQKALTAARAGLTVAEMQSRLDSGRGAERTVGG